MRRLAPALLLLACLLIPSVARSTGTASVPNNIAAQSGPNLAASLLDANWASLVNYINAREITLGTLGARPAASTSGRLYVATDVNGGTLYFDTGSAWTQIAPGVTSGLAETFTGLTLSNGGTNPSTTIGIAVGAASSDDTAITSRVLISLSGAFTKTTAAWSAGTGNGCLDAGSVAASTWYSVFAIYRSDTTVSDVLCSTSATAPVMPASYTNKRRIGSVLTDASKAINFFTQDADYFVWATATMTSTGNPGTAASSVTLNVPTGVNVQAVYNVVLSNTAVNSTLYLSDLASSDAAASETVAPTGQLHLNGATLNMALMSQVMTRTNTSAQIRFRLNASDGGTGVKFSTLGWWDRRGRG